MAVHLRVVENCGAQVRPSAEPRQTDKAQGDLRLRLIRAFSKISDDQERLRIVQIAEEAVDPIWDY
ncbi:MAG: hypothetical protein EKK40_15035 [Bradyrhizobiaceae bacterium]|nr:MAG: hypothetical protein EKK40_15035 [Bradyrhizobiaceae bacterium]